MAEAQVTAARFAREALRRRYGLPGGGSPALAETEFDKVNITIRREGRLRASMSGQGASLEQAIEAAVEKCARDGRFGGPLSVDEVEDCVVELWVQVGGEPLDNRGLTLGVDGVEIRLGGHYAYYKPSVPLTSELGTAAEVLEKLCGKAGLPPGAWRDPAAIVRRTEWLHVVESPEGEGRMLRRLRSPECPALDRASIAEAACAAGRRLAAGQNGDGSFLYRYDPLKDQAQPGRFSSVRHAGCAYSLAWLGDDFTWSAARALALLFRSARELPEDDAALYIAEGNGRQGRLGTSALTLLALQFEPLREMFAEHRAGLRRTLLAMQNAEGWFEPAIDRESPKESNQDYYPGEALVALGHELSCDSDAAIAAAFTRAFAYYRDYFRRRPTTAFILWQADAWRLFDEHSNGSSEYAGFVFEMADWLLQFQYTEGEFAGGFPRPSTPRYSSACYTEAIVRACGTALRHGDRARAARYREAARAGLRFVRRLQAGPESAFLFPRPELAVGGITANLNTFAMRSDFDQHAITAYLAALEVPGILDE